MPNVSRNSTCMVFGLDFYIAQCCAICASNKLEFAGLWVRLTAYYEAIVDGETITQYFIVRVFGHV